MKSYKMIRGIDEDIWRQFKILCALTGRSSAQALKLLILFYLANKK